MLVFLDPIFPLDALEAAPVAAYGGSGGDLLLAGPGTESVMRCYGYAPATRQGDSVQVSPPGAPPSARLGLDPDRVLVAVRDSDTAASDARQGAQVRCRRR